METYWQFYKPLTIINAFKSSGIYPVDSSVMSGDMLKPSLTFTDKEPDKTPDKDYIEE